MSGPMSVTITMKNPWAPFPYYLAQAQTGYVAAPSMLNNPNADLAPRRHRAIRLQGLGPQQPHDGDANPHYWRKGYPYLDSITYKPIIDPNARVAALETGEVDIIHTNSPGSLLQFRGNKKWSYYDNSGQVLGQPTVQCIMLNTSAPPFNNQTLRMAMAKCINQAQYAKVIDKGVDTPMPGLFIQGSPYYTPTAYPNYDPGGRGEAGLAGPAADGKPVTFNLNSTSNSETSSGRRSSFSRPSDRAGMSVNINMLAQSTLINDALAGTYQATLWRQFGAVDPDLNYVWFTSQLASGPLALNMARNVDPRIQTALVAGRTTGEKSARIKRTRRSTSTWPKTCPTCGWPVTRGRSSPIPRCRTSPTRRRSGLKGCRLRRGRALADPDLGLALSLSANASRRRRGSPRASGCSAPQGGAGSRSGATPRRSRARGSRR